MRQMRARQPDNAKADAEFSRLVKERDGYVCRMQRWSGRAYREHGIKGSPLNPLDAAHIYGRPHIPPSVRFEAIVGIAACRNCHELYDHRDDSVRVPVAREAKAFTAICRASKVCPVRRMPPERPMKIA